MFVQVFYFFENIFYVNRNCRAAKTSLGFLEFLFLVLSLLVTCNHFIQVKAIKKLQTLQVYQTLCGHSQFIRQKKNQ